MANTNPARAKPIMRGKASLRRSGESSLAFRPSMLPALLAQPGRPRSGGGGDDRPRSGDHDDDRPSSDKHDNDPRTIDAGLDDDNQDDDKTADDRPHS